MMIKLSICIPQYNRIKFLLESLRVLESQTYEHIEIVISDDCSKDDTEQSILQLRETYRFPIIYSRSKTNLGYDRNLREAIGLATGDYVLILGNDDTINPDCDLKDLIAFIEQNDFPDIGFINYFEEETREIIRRAQTTGILGSGPEVALKYYSCFSFVGGIVMKRSVFLQYNTNRFDGSIFTQIYLACVIMASGHVLFSIETPMIIKDILPLEQNRLSFKDNLPRKWKDYKKLNAGLPSVLNVMLSGFQDTGTLTQEVVYKAFRKIYSNTLPFWIMEYKKQKALPAAVGIIQGMYPPAVKNSDLLSAFNLFRIGSLYCFTSMASLLFPLGLFEKIRPAIYNWIKK